VNTVRLRLARGANPHTEDRGERREDLGSIAHVLWAGLRRFFGAARRHVGTCRGRAIVAAAIGSAVVPPSCLVEDFPPRNPGVDLIFPPRESGVVSRESFRVVRQRLGLLEGRDENL